MAPTNMGAQELWMKTGAYLFTLAALLGGASGACAKDTSLEPYSPLFLMYSGEPTAARLQGLQQFLRANNASKFLIQDTVRTVIYKLKTHKAGFAYPVYFSETAKQGNTCVVADSHNAHITDALSVLTSANIRQHVFGKRALNIPMQQVLDNVLEHEIFHCYDLLKYSQVELGLQIIKYGPKYFAYQGEAGADAYAALKHLRNGGDKQVLRQIRDFRTLNLLHGDAVHYTAAVLDHILWHYDSDRLKPMSNTQLIELANEIRDQTMLSADEFVAIDTAAQRFEHAFLTLVGETQKQSHTHAMDPQHLHRLVYDAPRPELLSQLMLQVRAALHNLGGDIGPGNIHFHKLFLMFPVPEASQSIRAALAR